MFAFIYSNQGCGVKRFNGKKYYLPKGIIKNYNVIIKGKNCYVQYIHSDIKHYKEIRKLTTGQGEDYITGCLHSHKKWKDSLEARAVLLLFSLELEISRVAVQSTHQSSKNGDFCGKLLSENDFENVLATFCCYDHGAKASEAVQKIAIDQKDYRKCSKCIIIC